MARYTASRRPLLIVLLLAVFLLYRYGFNAVPSTTTRSGSGSGGDAPTRGGSAAAAESKAERIAMVSMTTRETSYDHVAISNKYDYAAKHGYTMLFDYDGPRGYWDKLTDVEKAIRADKYDWVWWLDYDILITNSSIKITDIITEALAEAALAGKDPDKIDFIGTPDCFPFNAGSMVFRSTPWVLTWFEELWRCSREDMDEDRHLSEQDCMRDGMKNNVLQAGDKSIIIRQWKMNAFPEEIPCYDQRDRRKWERGMFVIHFAGAWAHMGDEKDPVGVLMKKYAEMVV